MGVPQKRDTAEIAQLVEHNLAKVGVASSSLVFRSRRQSKKTAFFFCISTYCKIFATLFRQNGTFYHLVENPKNSPKKAVSNPDVLQNVLHKCEIGVCATRHASWTSKSCAAKMHATVRGKFRWSSGSPTEDKPKPFPPESSLNLRSGTRNHNG